MTTEAETVGQVRKRAARRCEYCQLPSSVHPAPFRQTTSSRNSAAPRWREACISLRWLPGHTGT